MLLAELGDASRAVAATRSRLRKRALLARLFSEADPERVGLAVNYLTGTLPQGRIGLGPAIVRRALDGIDGAAADPALDLAAVDGTFDTIATTRGKGSTERREACLRSLFERCSIGDREFLARLLLGELRQGALEAVILESIAEASGLDDAEIRRAAMLTADPAIVATTALEDGLDGLRRFRLAPLAPVRPMLAQPAGTLGDAIAAVPDAAQLEYKLDGARVQVHRDGDAVRVFTRQLNDVTDNVPEIVATALSLPAEQLILDGEAIVLRADGSPQPFQVTMRRFGRKASDERVQAELPLSVFVFDCLFVDGESLLDCPLHERMAVLDRLAPDIRVPRLRTGEPAAAHRFLRQALADGHEGVMVKTPASGYAAGSRGADWLKVKEAHTLDLVVLAAEWGSGRRSGRLSNLHLGARDGDGFVMLGKTFKGLTDRLLAWQTGALLERELERDEHTVYVQPELVVEIAVNEIQASPHYPAGMALRFARVKRYRDDKAPAEADTIETVRALFRQQNPA